MATEARDVKVRFETEGDGAEPFEQGADAVETLDERIKRVDEALSDLDRSLDQIDENLGIPNLAKSTEAAEREMKGLQEAIERGFEGAEGRLARVRLALNAYEQDLRRAAATGADVTGDQIEGLRLLEAEYQNAARQVGQFKAAQQQARKDLDQTTTAAGGTVTALTGLGDVAVALGGTFARFAGPVAAVIGTFLTFYNGTKLVVEKLKEMGVDTDELARKMIPIVGIAEKVGNVLIEKWVGAADESHLLANQMNVLTKAGYDLAGMTKEQINKAYEQYTEKLRENRGELEAQQEAWDKWRESLGPTKEELDKVAEALIQNIEKLKETEQNLSDSELAALVGPKIDALIAEYNRIRAEVPSILQDARDQIASFAIGTGESFSSMKDKIQQAVDGFRAALRPIPDDLAAEAEAVGISINAWERHNEIFTITPSKAREAGEAVKDAGQKAGEGAKGLGEQATAAEDAAQAAGTFAGATDSAASATERLASGATQAKDGLSGIGEATEGLGAKIASDLAGAEEAIAGLVSQARAAKEELAGLKQAIETGNAGSPAQG